MIVSEIGTSVSVMKLSIIIVWFEWVGCGANDVASRGVDKAAVQPVHFLWGSLVPFHAKGDDAPIVVAGGNARRHATLPGTRPYEGMKQSISGHTAGKSRR